MRLSLLRSGALPAPLNIIEERTVGPDLGQDSINAGMIALIIGFMLVIIFMFVKYKIFGLITAATIDKLISKFKRENNPSFSSFVIKSKI